jgi:acylpyruvate hydrolase
MRLATIRTPQGERLHVRGGSGFVDLGVASRDEQLASLGGLLSRGPSAFEAAESASTQDGREVADADFAAAVPSAGRVLCLGLNYGDHAKETGWTPPSWPESFVRGRQSIIGPYDDLIKPALSSQFDFEGELAVVIGKGGRYIPAEKAFDAVLGFTILNEASARDWQRAAKQWTPGKNFDSTMPLGPEIVTPEDIDISDLELITTLNGVVMQSGRTSQMLISVAQSIEFFSSFTTLAPGDVIATGTPAGVGFTRTPPVYLLPGDIIEVAIAGIGKIRNRVVAETNAPESWAWSAPDSVDGVL